MGRVGGVRAKGDHYWSGEGWRSEAILESGEGWRSEGRELIS